MAINPFLNKDEMTSRRSFHIPPLSSSVPEFTQSSVLLSSQSRVTEKKLHSKKRRSQDDPAPGSAAFRARRLADIPRRVERIKEADAWPRDEIPRTPGPYQLSDWDQCSNRAQVSSPGLEPEYELCQTAPLEPHGVSLEAAIDNWRGSRQLSHLAHDGGFAYAGSWCYTAPVKPSHLELEWHNPERVVLADDWCPETPRDTRLSTPDLPPLSTDFEFCPCHGSGEHEKDRINQEFYLATRSKMDVQMINALAHIAQDQTVSGSAFRQVSREMKDA